MSAAVPLVCLIALLGLLSMLQAHHPWKASHDDRALTLVAAALGLVVLVMALSRVLALT